MSSVLSEIVPAQNAQAITLSDSTTYTPFRAFYVGTAGDVKVDTQGGQAVTFKNVPAGSVIPVKVTRFYSTGTTASNLVAIY